MDDRSELYLKHAAEAEALARRAVSRAERLRLLELADGWRILAERVRMLTAQPAAAATPEARA